MVGWCSPMYPNLLLKESEIPVDMDATAMIAGFLMIGNMFGTLPAHFVPFGTKYGILAGLILMMISWFVMWQAGNIYCILVSRFLIGFGNSFGTHHGKEYIKQMSEKPLRDNLVKSVQIYIGIGILVGYCFGPYVDFRTYSVIALIVTTVICVYSLFLPHSPVELIRYDNISKAETVLAYLKPGVDIDREIKEIKSNLHDQNLDLGLDIIRNKTLSCNFTILMFLIFFQQLCGAPSTLIYCMLILQKLSYPNPEILAIIYVILFILGNAIGSFYLHQYNIKYCLLLSSLFSSLVLVLNTLILYFDFYDVWFYTPYILLSLYIFFHSLGLGPLPFLLTPKIFPKTNFVSHVQTIFYSIWAIVVTKTFQVLFTRHPLYISFLMFSIAGVLGTFFILIFIPSDLSRLTENKRSKNNQSSII